MDDRLQELINRGYSKKDIIRLINYSESDFNNLASKAFNHISRNCFYVLNPQAIFIGGQPGCGKSSMALNLKKNLRNVVEIGIDNFRMYHPNYKEIEQIIKNHWINKEETEMINPGNDMAELTNIFAGAMTDKLLELALKNNYNIIMDWGMREPNAPLKTMQILKNSSYYVIVNFIAVNKNLSYNSCNFRDNISINSKHIVRKVSKYFHDYCLKMLPYSIDYIYTFGKKHNYFDEFYIITRAGKILWKDGFISSPGEVFRNILEDVN